MKKFYVFLVLMSFQRVSLGQVGPVDINDMITPVSPGFVLADEAPSSISRPTNPRGLVASILTLNRGGAIETSPYWLLPIEGRKNLTFLNYINNHFPIAQTLSISASSLRSETATYLSAGGRFHLVRFYGKNTITLYDRIVKMIEPRIGPNGNPLPLPTDAIEKARDSLNQVKPTFLIEVAGAWLGYSPANNFEQLGNARNGIWANISFRPDQTFNLIFLTRYINNKQQKTFSEKAEFFDFGGSLGLEKNKNFTVNGEFVFRRDLITDMNTQRIAVVANYKLIDQFYIVGSFGKNFGQVDNLISILGISLGLNNEPLNFE